MQFSIATLLAISAASVMAIPAPDTSNEVQSLEELHDIYSNALAQVEEVQAAKEGGEGNDEVNKRQPGGLTCLIGGDAPCWASVCAQMPMFHLVDLAANNLLQCFAQTACGGYCADTGICTCHNC